MGAGSEAAIAVGKAKGKCLTAADMRVQAPSHLEIGKDKLLLLARRHWTDSPQPSVPKLI